MCFEESGELGLVRWVGLGVLDLGSVEVLGVFGRYQKLLVYIQH